MGSLWVFGELIFDMFELSLGKKEELRRLIEEEEERERKKQEEIDQRRKDMFRIFR